MSLKSLKLAAAAPAVGIDPQQRGRDKLIAYLEDQKQLAAAKSDGGQYTPTRFVRRKNEAGDTIEVEAPRHVKRGWYRGVDGNLYFQIKYGSKPLELGKGVNAVVLQSIAEVPAAAEALINAVSAGELDNQLRVASEARRAAFASRTKKGAAKPD
ncbi:DUF6641 family protein [Sphingomonas sp. RB1R13]|uniref:DUF6641 family protein n=1 Tax=Sphingomonas sp. RB1R13 TaxID=3096159 RepID=UPI002FCAD013